MVRRVRNLVRRLVFLIGRRLLTSQAALVAAFILPSVYLHFQISRWATTDMTLSFFILCAFYFFIKGFQDESCRRRNFYLFYIAMALGFLTKGPPAILLPGLTIAAFLFVRGDWKMISEMRLSHGLLILLVLDVPWFAAMYFLHGDEFLDHLLGRNSGTAFSIKSHSAFTILEFLFAITCPGPYFLFVPSPF